MPAPTAPPSAPLNPAEQAIADSRAAYDAFIQQANAEVYQPAAQSRSGLASVADALAAAQPTQQAANGMGQQLSAAAQQAAGVTSTPASAQPSAPSNPPRSPDGRFAPRDTSQTAQPISSPPAAPAAPQAPAAIPGPPAAGASAAAPGQAAPAAPSQAASAPPATATPAVTSPPTGVQPPDFADIPPASALDNRGSILTRADWKKLHGKADWYAQQVQELQAKLAQTAQHPSTTQPPAELQQQLTALQAERDDYRQRLERVAFEQSPQFQQMFTTREKAATLMAKQAVGPEKADQIDKLFKLPESVYRNQQITALYQEIAETDPIRAGKLTSAIAIIDQLGAEKQTVLENSKQYISQLQQQQAQQEQQAALQRQQRVDAVFNQEVQAWRAARADLVDEQGLAIAKEVYAGNRSLEDIARAALWVAVGPRAVATANQLQQQLASAQAELARLRSVQPGTASDAGGNIVHDTEVEVLQQPKMGQYAEAIIAAGVKAGLPWR